MHQQHAQHTTIEAINDWRPREGCSWLHLALQIGWEREPMPTRTSTNLLCSQLCQMNEWTLSWKYHMMIISGVRSQVTSSPCPNCTHTAL